MAGDVVLKPSGLFTDPNPISAVPPGALREADNVVIRRDGILQPRPGFKKTLLVDGLGDPDTASFVRIIPWGTSVLTYESDGTAAFHLVEFGGTVQNAPPYLVTGAAGTDFVARSVEARANLYVASARGIIKYTDVTDFSPDIAGVDPVTSMLAIQSGASGFLAIGDAVSYRAVAKETDSNGVITYSAPTARYVARNSAGTSVDVSVTVFGPLTIGATVQIYRSTSATTPDDNLYLAYEHVVTSADYVAKFFTFTDSVEDVDLGASLYTNAAQEGILQASRVPPRVNDLTLFRSSLFGANVKGTKSANLTFTYGTASLTASATGIGQRLISGTTTGGSAVITGVADTSGIEAGQILVGSGLGNGSDFVVGGALATVVSKTVNTITMSAVSGAVRTPGSFYFNDAIQVGTDSFFANGPYELLNGVNLGTAGGLQYSVSGYPSTLYSAELVTAYDPSLASQVVTVVIHELLPGLIADSLAFFGVNATHADEWRPAVGTIGDTYTADEPYVDANLVINGLIYSKADQPEAMPYPANVIRVGSSSHAIDRILATKDALWIFKRDGIFRLTGSGAPNWRVDPFDMSMYLIAVDSAVVMDDAIFAWTNRGVVRISDAGIVQISSLAIGADLRVAELYGMSQSNEGKPFGSPTSAVSSAGWAIANVKDNEYILAVPTDLTIGEGVSYTVTPYVYNTKTLAWTRWAMRHAVTSGAVSGAGKILFGGLDVNDDGCLSVERTTLDPVADGAINADWNYADVGNGVVTLDYFFTSDPEVYTMELSAAFEDWIPAVGDVLYFNGNPGIITSVESALEFTIYITDAVPADMNVANVRETIPCEVEFVAKIGGQPASDKMWRDGTLMWGSSKLLDRATLSFTSSLISAAVSSTMRAADWPDNDADVAWNAPFWIPRNHSRSAILYPNIAVSNADSAWQIYGITLAVAGTGRSTR